MAKKSKFLLVSLQEDQAKKLAQVLSNDTSRKIIDHLADKEDTEANIAKILGLPISTVHYNLTLLTQGGLVDAGEFHYSTKGREVKHYKLANQYILIAPRSTFGLKERLKGLLPAVGVLGGVSLALRWLASPVQPLADTFAQSGAQDAGIAAMRALPQAASAAMKTAVEDVDMMATASSAAQTVQEQSIAMMPTSPVTDIVQATPWDIGLLIFIGGLITLALYIGIEYARYRYKRLH